MRLYEILGESSPADPSRRAFIKQSLGALGAAGLVSSIPPSSQAHHRTKPNKVETKGAAKLPKVNIAKLERRILKNSIPAMVFQMKRLNDPKRGFVKYSNKNTSTSTRRLYSSSIKLFLKAAQNYSVKYSGRRQRTATVQEFWDDTNNLADKWVKFVNDNFNDSMLKRLYTRSSWDPKNKILLKDYVIKERNTFLQRAVNSLKLQGLEVPTKYEPITDIKGITQDMSVLDSKAGELGIDKPITRVRLRDVRTHTTKTLKERKSIDSLIKQWSPGKTMTAKVNGKHHTVNPFGYILKYGGTRAYGPAMMFKAGLKHGLYGSDMTNPNNYKIAASWLAQLQHESKNYLHTQEILSGKQYDITVDRDIAENLGNIKPGDGKRFKGRGPLQITGRWNYDYVGRKIGKDLIKHPELLQQFDIGAHAAVVFWNYRRASQAAKSVKNGDFTRVTRRINPGENKKAIRKRNKLTNYYVRKLKKGWIPS